MNVFEDLLVELQDENLLEKTAIDADRSGGGIKNRDLSGQAGLNCDLVKQSPQIDLVPTDKISDLEMPQTAIVLNDDVEKSEPHKRPRNGREFYQNRAVAEISNLQMVEHVLTGVEREYMKVVPNGFDDFSAKKALNAFMLVTSHENSDAHTEAEFNLMNETEAWCTALSNRDKKVPVSNLRQYCENSRPPLSSQALLSLARFYRNLPYSEAVRAKFDFLITRLCSRAGDDNKRVCLFTRDEIHAHINTLYNDWSSIALYGADDDRSNVLLTALSFEDLVVEAENAGGFDQLVESDFFGRLRLFKESIAEMFYAPHVTAAAIETNVRVGNAYVNLIDRERRKLDAESIQSKYGDTHDDSISDATARTVELVDLLRSRAELTDDPEELSPQEESASESVPESPPPSKSAVVEAVSEDKPVKETNPFFSNLVEKALAVNRWFLGIALLLIAVSFALYIYSNFMITEAVPSASVQTVELENSLREHLKTGKISSETFYGILEPSWDALPKEKRQEFTARVLAAGREKGYNQVNLITKTGNPAAFASATRMEIIMP